MKENDNSPSGLVLLSTTYEVRTEKNEYTIKVINWEAKQIQIDIYELIDEDRNFPFADPDNLRYVTTHLVDGGQRLRNTRVSRNDLIQLVKELNQTNKEI